MAADNGKVRHANHLNPPSSIRESVLLHIRITRPLGFHLLEKAFVDLEDDLKMARQDFLKEPDSPFFQGLRQAVYDLCKRMCS